MKRISPSFVLGISLSFVLGLLTPFVAILAAEPFEVHGQNSFRENLAGFLAVVLYCAFCQFWVAAKGSGGLGAKWPTLVAMNASLVMIVLMWFTDTIGRFLIVGGPLLVTGCLGSLAGAAIADKRAPQPHHEGEETDARDRLMFCRRSLLAGAAVLTGAALVLAFGVMPLVKADLSPMATPHQAVAGLWVTVAFSLFAAAVLAFVALRAAGRDRISTGILGVPAFLAFLLTFALFAPAAGFLGHGPAMRTASILLFLCAAVDLFTVVLVTATAVAADRASLASG